jgi:hypothetical protein
MSQKYSEKKTTNNKRRNYLRTYSLPSSLEQDTFKSFNSLQIKYIGSCCLDQDNSVDKNINMTRDLSLLNINHSLH